jgi:predicted RNA-binding Zn ribbon-like protein
MTPAELIVAFVNTRELPDGVEVLDSPAGLEDWLDRNGLDRGGGPASEGDLVRAVELREALRRLLLANTGLEVDTEPALAALDLVARRARVELRFGGGAGELVPAGAGVTGALGRIAIAVHAAQAEGTWERLKACRAADCEWAFLDTARNHARAWCSMRSCGNREKARAFRERQRERSSSR